jgi:hypothetical protein
MPFMVFGQVDDEFMENYLLDCMNRMQEKMFIYDPDRTNEYWQGRQEAYEHIYMQILYWKTLPNSSC